MNTVITTSLAYFKLMGIKPNFSELSRKHNIDRHTLKKHYDAGGIKPRKKREYTSYYDEYKQIIKEKLEIDGITYIGIFKFLVNEKGLKGTYSNFKAYLKSNELCKVNKKSVPHVRYETPPGKQMQVDWKEDIKLVTKDGEVLEFNLFGACLSNSRIHTFIYSETKTIEAYMRCQIEAFRRIGGKTKEILTDNMSAIVNVLGLNKKRKHDKILQFEKDLGVQIKLCKARSPETKGKVESQNRFVSRLLAYNNEIESLDHLLRIIEKLNIDINNEPNKTTNIAPCILFKKEKEYLLPLPSKCILDQYSINDKTCIVPSTLLIDYKGNQYSVPKEYINKRVKILEINNKLHIYFNTELITIHDISNKMINYKKEHYTEALKETIKNKDLDIKKIAEENLKLLSEGFNDK